MNEIATLFGGITAVTGGRVTGGLARQTRREMEVVTARAEIAHHTNKTRAFLASEALNSTAAIVSEAERMMQLAPSGAQFYEAIVAAFAIGAGNSVAHL